MAGLVAKLVFQKILRENPENDHGREDPYFETVPTNRMSLTGNRKVKRRKKALPPGLSEADQKTLVKVKRRAYRLDMALGTCCGMKIGWSSVIGIIPGIGDVLDTLLALMVVRTASEVGLPPQVRMKMIFNIIMDFVVGLIPILGDLADVAYKANTRNAIILEDYLRERGAENLRRQGLPPQPDPSLGEDEPEVPSGRVVNRQPIPEPQPSYHAASRGGKGGWFSKLTGGTREYDVEQQRPVGGSRGGNSRMGSQQNGTTRGR